MSHFAGVGVGRQVSSLCIVDEAGAVCLERTVAFEIEEIAVSIRRFADQVEGVALETGRSRRPCRARSTRPIVATRAA
ncbi:hypothetical protein BIWAKO_06815 [Bosea sp. BIWAKO-01]|nr:hypothetical protein BIWAKO_06815 [Bosea sp. BIWAKO-01]